MPAAPDVTPESILSRLETLGIKLGLERSRVLLAALGEPQRRFSAVLVAGTNGKGSTSALLAAMARAAGYRTGLYTSPHLENVEERLQIDGRPIEPGPFAGPRVIEQTIRQSLPEGFQRSEFLLEHGFLDMVVHRAEMKETLARCLRHLT